MSIFSYYIGIHILGIMVCKSLYLWPYLKIDGNNHELFVESGFEDKFENEKKKYPPEAHNFPKAFVENDQADTCTKIHTAKEIHYPLHLNDKE